jgi:hypothetical protein
LISPTGEILRRLFASINNLDYVVLRGFEELPDNFSNDIDIAVHPSQITEFIKQLAHFAQLNNLEIIQRDQRFQVLKLKLKNESSGIDLDVDVWWGFNYVGLIYLDILEFVSRPNRHNEIKVIQKEYEVALSFLKELIHNGRFRKDKEMTIRSKMSTDFNIPFEKYFSKKNIDKFSFSIKNSIYDLSELSKIVRWDLLINSIRHNPSAVYIGIWNYTKYRFFVRYKILNLKEKF